MIKGLEHVGLCAENPKALADWYVAVLEFSLVRELPEQRTYFIRASDGNMLEVYPAKHPTEQVDNLH